VFSTLAAHQNNAVLHPTESMSIELRFHHTGGKVYRYEQTEAVAVQQLLRLVAPAKVFTEPEIVLSGGGIVTLVSTAHITRLDVVTSLPLGWPKQPNITAMFVLPDKSALRARALRADGPKQAGESIVVHLAYDLVGGTRLYAEVAAKAGHPLETRSRLNRLLRKPPVYFSLPGGGATILNPVNIIRVMVTANIDRTPIGAWPLHLQTAL
jgi:hypothetical protein